MRKKKLRNTRPKALFGEIAAAGITAAATLAAAGIGAAAANSRRRERGSGAVGIFGHHRCSIITVVPQQLTASAGCHLGTHKDRQEVVGIEILGIDAHVAHRIEHGAGRRVGTCRYRHGAHQLLAGVWLEQLSKL